MIYSNCVTVYVCDLKVGIWLVYTITTFHFSEIFCISNKKSLWKSNLMGSSVVFHKELMELSSMVVFDEALKVYLTTADGK